MGCGFRERCLRKANKHAAAGLAYAGSFVTIKVSLKVPGTELPRYLAGVALSSRG